MSALLQHKVVNALPVPPEADSIYYVRKGEGFDIVLTNSLGVVVGYQLNALIKAEEALATKVDQTSLGTAATRNVTVGNADVASGRLLKVGDLGSNKHPIEVIDFNDLPDLYPYSGLVPVMSNHGSTNTPLKSSYYYIFQSFYDSGQNNVTQIAIPYRVDDDGFFLRNRYDSVWSPWREVLHSGNILSATGQSTEYPMSQKAVTDAINARGFADASGILTVTSGALSNDMSSFLSQTTKSTMRSNLEVPQLNATATEQGGLKARLDGTTLYLTNNGTNP